MNKQVAVIIPTYNAAGTIVPTTSSIIKKIPSAEVYVIDDNSPDGTAKKVKEYFKTNKNIHVIVRKEKDGRGSAVLHGFREALKKKTNFYFVELDADLCHHPKYIPEMIKKTKNTDMVIVSKYLPKSTIVGLTLKRKVMSKMMNFAARQILRVPISDYSNGYRLYTRDVVEYITRLEYQSKGFVVLSETVYKVHKKGFKISEIPFDFIQQSSQNSNMNFGEIKEAVRTLLQLRFKKI